MLAQRYTRLCSLPLADDHLVEALRQPDREGLYPRVLNYVAGELKKHFPGAVIDAVTGELAPEERRERVEHMGEADAASGRVLVATDCLSEGINLQHLFTAVVHYDMAWNPTRHEQREGPNHRLAAQG